jgi:hypothetical protein
MAADPYAEFSAAPASTATAAADPYAEFSPAPTQTSNAATPAAAPGLTTDMGAPLGAVIGDTALTLGSSALKSVSKAGLDLLSGPGGISPGDAQLLNNPVLNYQPHTAGGATVVNALGTLTSPIGKGLAYTKSKLADIAGPQTANVVGDLATLETADTGATTAEKAVTPPLTGAAANAQKILDTQAANTAKSAGAAAAAPQLASASPELQQAIAARVNAAGTSVDPAPIARHIEADSLPVPVQLTEGQAIQSPTLISEEANLRGADPRLVARFNEQNGHLADNIQAIRDQAGPDVFSTNPVEHGDTLIKAYQDVDASRQADIAAKYQALRDGAGGSFPIDTSALLGNVRGALSRQLLTDDAPPSIMRVLDSAAASGSMSFEQFENLRTNLATVQRSAQDGLARRSAGVIRDQLEQIPLSPAAAPLKATADAARAAARDRFQALDADPAYQAAVDGSVPPDRFVGKFVVNGTRDGVAQMRSSLAGNPQAQQTMAVSALDHLRDQAGVGPGNQGNFSQAGYNRALQGLQPKIRSLVDPKTADQLEALGNVARYTLGQPRGSFVNHSNTLTGALAEHTSDLVEHGITTLAAAHGIPGAGLVVRGGKALIKGKSLKSRVDRALAVGAGVGPARG